MRVTSQTMRAMLCTSLLVATMTALTACDVPAPTSPAITPGLVVFSVLDPAATEQTILLMQSRPAVTDTTSRPVLIDDPIVSAGEIPVIGARVVLYSSTGDSAVAIEDRVRRTDHLGAGVYRLRSTTSSSTLPLSAYLPITAGARYTLRVRSTVGNAEGTTRVPSTQRALNVAARTVNLSRDTVLLGESELQAAGFMYALRNSNNTGMEGDPQFRRNVERRLILPSGNDWAFAYAREQLKLGTRHTLTITALDSSYFGYFGSEGDPFADRTARTTLRGATGVFGSVLLIYASIITVSGL